MGAGPLSTVRPGSPLKSRKVRPLSIISHWGQWQRSQHKRHRWNRPQGWEGPSQSHIHWACGASTSTALPTGDNAPQLCLVVDECSQEKGSPTFGWLSAPYSPCSHTHASTSLQRPGQVKGADKLSFLYSLQKCQVFALRLLLNIDFKTQIGSFGHLGLSIRYTDSSTSACNWLRISGGRLSRCNFLGKNRLFIRCENPTCKSYLCL